MELMRRANTFHLLVWGRFGQFAVCYSKITTTPASLWLFGPRNVRCRVPPECRAPLRNCLSSKHRSCGNCNLRRKQHPLRFTAPAIWFEIKTLQIEFFKVPKYSKSPNCKVALKELTHPTKTVASTAATGEIIDGAAQAWHNIGHTWKPNGWIELSFTPNGFR